MLWRTLLLAPVLMVIMSFFIGVYFDAHAQQSELYQEIKEPDCRAPGDCEMLPPTIDDIRLNNNRPVFKGTYDALYSEKLRVVFGGVTYVLGVNSQLKTANGQWILDLSGLTNPLARGAYELIVETEGYDGKKLRAETIVTITSQQAPTTAAPADPETIEPSEPGYEQTPSDPVEIPQPMELEEAKAKVSLIPLILVVAASITLFGIVFGLQRWNPWA